jgi:uncharacterized oxidoreductase
MPDVLYAFTMAICRADGSSAEEARLVADHLVLATSSVMTATAWA